MVIILENRMTAIFFLDLFFGSKISQISSCHHPVSNGLRRCLASWCHLGCSMLETDLVHNLNATFWNYLSQALITIILISSYLEGRQYSETLASYHHPMLLGAFMFLLYVRMHALAVSLVFWSSQVFASPSDHLRYRGHIFIFCIQHPKATNPLNLSL